MTSLADRPRFTEIYDAADFVLPSASVFVSRNSEEDRSQHVEELASRCADSRFVAVEEETDGYLSIRNTATPTTVALRNVTGLAEFWAQYATSPTYFDITGLTHTAWAPMLRGALLAGLDLRVVYVEPLSYRFNEIRTEGELFDLSVKFGGIEPLPGFLSLVEPAEDEVILVPLLGFEGPRLSMVLNQVDVPRDRVFPVVGVPGFRPEFVYYAYQGNRLPLEETGSWMAVEYAAANCPFSAFYLLEQILRANTGMFMRVAPIGTKPHGLGAVLFALANPDRVELVYDHPVRRSGRTSGAARLLVYHLAAMRDRLRV